MSESAASLARRLGVTDADIQQQLAQFGRDLAPFLDQDGETMMPLVRDELRGRLAAAAEVAAERHLAGGRRHRRDCKLCHLLGRMLAVIAAYQQIRDMPADARLARLVEAAERDRAARAAVIAWEGSHQRGQQVSVHRPGRAPETVETSGIAMVLDGVPVVHILRLGWVPIDQITDDPATPDTATAPGGES